MADPIAAKVDNGALIGGLQALAAKLGNMREPLALFGSTVQERAVGTFREARDPWGKTWAPLAPSTLKKRRKGSSSPLLDTGRLRASFSHNATDSSVEVGSNVAYAPVHQFGTTIQRAAFSSWVNLRTTARGDLLRQGKEGRLAGLAVFAKASHKRTTRRNFTSGGYSITIPARPSLPIRNGAVDLPADWLKEGLEAFRDFIPGVSRA